MSKAITGVRQKAPEYGTSNGGKDWGRTIIAVDFSGATRLVHVFTLEKASIAALKHFHRGDRLAVTGDLIEVDYVTKDGRGERLFRVPFATGLKVIPKQKRRSA